MGGASKDTFWHPMTRVQKPAGLEVADSAQNVIQSEWIEFWFEGDILFKSPALLIGPDVGSWDEALRSIPTTSQ